MYAVGFRRAVAHYKNPQLASRRFDRLVNLARRRSKPFRPNLKVIDEAFDGGFHFLARRWNDPGSLGAERSLGRNLLHCLLNDLDALANLGDAHLVTRITIAGGLRLHVEI